MTTFLRRVHDRMHDERGMAMVTALLAVIVAAILGATVVNLSIHTSQASAYDRARTQSIHAAEAGLDSAMSHFQAISIDTLPCTVSGTLNATPVATFTVTLTYYESFPLTGTALPCVGGYVSSTTVPGGVSLESTGTVAGWQSGTVERHMQSELSLEPIYGTFGKAIFSDQTPGIANRLTVYGEDGNDADVITNGDFNCTNSLTVYGSIYAQGGAAWSNSCRTTEDLWTNGSITFSNSARADHDIKSSTGSLTMGNSSSAGNNIQVAGSCTGCSGRYGGTLTTGYTQGPPPAETFPDITFDADAWTDDGYQVLSYTDCSAAKDWITDATNKSTKAVIHITGGCTLNFANNTTVIRNEDLAVFTDGEISTTNNTSFTSGNGAWHNLYLIVGNGSTCTAGQGYVSMSNLTTFEQLYFFVYSPCTSTFANNNSTGHGQVYGKTVTLSNNLTFTFHAMLVPGAGTITGFDGKVQFVREVN